MLLDIFKKINYNLLRLITLLLTIIIFITIGIIIGYVVIGNGNIEDIYNLKIFTHIYDLIIN